MARTYEQITQGLGNRFLFSNSVEATASLTPEERRILANGLLDGNRQLDVHAAVAPWLNNPTMKKEIFAAMTDSNQRGNIDALIGPYLGDPLAQQASAQRGPGGGFKAGKSSVVPTTQRIANFTRFTGGSGNRGGGFDLTPTSQVERSGREVFVDGKSVGTMATSADAGHVSDDILKIINTMKSNNAANINAGVATATESTTGPGIDAPTPDRVPGTGAPSRGPADDAADAAANTKQKFDLRKTEFSRDIVPQIQQKLNASGLLESGATPEALARALRGAGSATTVEELNALEKSTLAGFDPVLGAAQRYQVGQANRTLGGASYDITQMLNGLRMGAGQAEQPDVLAQLLGVGTGIGGNLLAGSLRRKRPTTTPNYENASSLDLYSPGSYRSSVPY